MRRYPAPRPAAALLSLLVLAVSLAASPAHANPEARPLPIIGRGAATFYVNDATGLVEVRATGTIPADSTRVTGLWTLTIAGVRQATPTSVPAPFTRTWSSNAYSVTHSEFFYQASQYGAVHVRWDYTAVGPYVTVESHHSAAWTPSTGFLTAGLDVQQ